MKKLLLSILLFVILIPPGQAQKRTTKVTGLYYTILPKQQLDESLRKYKPVLETDLNFLSPEERLKATAGIKDQDEKIAALREALQKAMPGMAMRHLTFNDPDFIPVQKKQDFTVKVTTSDIHVTYIADRITDLEMEDVVTRYSFNAELTVTDNDGNLLLQKDVHRPVEEQKLTKAELFFEPKTYVEFRLKQKNEKKKRKILNRLINDYKRKLLAATLQRAEDILNEEFCSKYESVQLHISAAKKKYDYEQLKETQENIATTMNRLRSLSKKKRLTDQQVTDRMKSAMDIWEKELQQEDLADKKARINAEIADGLRVNLAIACLWLKDYDKAQAWLDQVEDSKPESGGMIVKGSFKDNAQQLRKVIEEFTNKKELVIITNAGRQDKT